MTAYREFRVATGEPVLVSADDYERVTKNKWCLKRSSKSGRTAVQRNTSIRGRRVTIALHRFILDAAPGVFIDHINGDPLDNRRENLRIVTPEQNAQNVTRSKNQKRGGYKGVYQHKKSGRWCAGIGSGERNKRGKRKRIHLGCFATPQEAARAYDAAAIRFFGEYAALNFPTDPLAQQIASGLDAAFRVGDGDASAHAELRDALKRGAELWEARSAAGTGGHQ